MTSFSGMILALLMTASAARFAEAQQPPSPSQSQPPASAQSQAQAHEWTPQGIEDLRESAASKTEFTLDHSMLVFASKLEPDEDLRRVIAGVSGISVHNYRFARNWQFDVAAVDSVNDEYRTAGWKQLMNEREKNGPGETDLWIRFENNAIRMSRFWRRGQARSIFLW